MKKLGIALGLAAVATFTGCKDPDYVGKHGRSVQDDVKTIDTTPAKPGVAARPETASKPAATIKVEERKTCTCPPGTKHSSPCACGLADCRCVVEKPVEPAPAMTAYIVQRGDYLAKISKKFNITIAAIRKANPSLKNDTIRIGQKLMLPGKVDVGEQKVPAQAASAKSARSSKAFTPYTGATREYVVKSGDTLGAVAYGNGINIRQLKELNGLTGDALKVGQKLKVPEAPVAGKSAQKPAQAKAADAAPAVVAKPVAGASDAAAAKGENVTAPEVQAAPVEKAAQDAAAQPLSAAAAAAEAATTTYVVAEGDDMTSVSISFGVSAAAIRELNNLGEKDQLKPGQIIKLPADVQQ